MVASVAPGLRYQRVKKKLTDGNATVVMTVGSGELLDRTAVNLLGILIADSTGSVDTAATITWTDARDSDDENTIVNGIEVPTDWPMMMMFSPAIPLFDGDTVKVTGASGHHVLCIVQVAFDPGGTEKVE